jgi:hypothetical protein
MVNFLGNADMDNDSGMNEELEFAEWIAEMKARLDNKLAEMEVELQKTRKQDE